MITSALLSIVNTLIAWFLAARPVWQPTLPPSVASLIAFSEAFDKLLPINECLTVTALMGTGLTTFLTLKWGVKIVDWVADVIP